MDQDYVRRYLLLAVLSGLATIVFFLCSERLPGVAADDSFIHRRIALNYQTLGKPYFNPGERVMVTSSPLWTLLLSLAGATLPVDNPVPCLELAFILAGAGAAYLLLVDRSADHATRFALPALAFVSVCVADFPSAMAQMETPCAVALILAGCYGLWQQKTWGLALLVMACFTRYECVVLFTLAGAWVTVKHQWTMRSLLIATSTALADIAWLLWEYGTIIPNTVVAKSHLYAMTYRQVARGFVSVPEALLCAELGVLWWFYGRKRQQSAAATLLLGFGIALGLAYLIRKTYIFAWYPPLVVAPVTIAVLLGTNERRGKAIATRGFFTLSLLLPSAITGRGMVLAAVRARQDSIPGYAVVARVHEYGRIGTALYRECPTGILMTSEIGALGWGFRGEIEDGAGLASPAAIQYHPMRVPEERRSGTLGEIPAGFVRARHPDLIVSYDELAESALPAARSLGYIDYAYPLFVRGDRTSATVLWDARQMHVLVAPHGRCSPEGVKHAVGAALEQ